MSTTCLGPPGKTGLGFFGFLRSALEYARAFGFNLPRARRVGAALERHHPKHPPHVHFVIAGIVPSERRSGALRALTGAVLDRYDAERIPAYTEAESPEGLVAARSVGFVPTGTVTLEDGPTITTMWREPRSQGSTRIDERG